MMFTNIQSAHAITRNIILYFQFLYSYLKKLNNLKLQINLKTLSLSIQNAWYLSQLKITLAEKSNNRSQP